VTQRTFSLEQVAEIALPGEWRDPIRWLQRRLRHNQISGYKVGNTWRMTENDVEDLIARHRNSVTAASAIAQTDDQAGISAQSSGLSFIDGLSERSRGRLQNRVAS
jgi:hypothetical protein